MGAGWHFEREHGGRVARGRPLNIYKHLLVQMLKNTLLCLQAWGHTLNENWLKNTFNQVHEVLLHGKRPKMQVKTSVFLRRAPGSVKMTQDDGLFCNGSASSQLMYKEEGDATHNRKTFLCTGYPSKFIRLFFQGGGMHLPKMTCDANIVEFPTWSDTSSRRTTPAKFNEETGWRGVKDIPTSAPGRIRYMRHTAFPKEQRIKCREGSTSCFYCVVMVISGKCLRERLRHWLSDNHCRPQDDIMRLLGGKTRWLRYPKYGCPV